MSKNYLVEINDGGTSLIRVTDNGSGIEADDVIIESGVFEGYTTGAPVLLRFLNQNTITFQ